MTTRDILYRLEQAEQAFLTRAFLAPFTGRGRVQVRVAGVVCTLNVDGSPEPGWYRFRPLSMERAEVVAPATRSQIAAYLALFPRVRLILVDRGPRGWNAAPAHRGDRRIQIEGQVPVHLVAGGEPFAQVWARYDGRAFWYEGPERRRSGAVGAFLRRALAAEVPAPLLRLTTLSREERGAYAMALEARRRARIGADERRLRAAVDHGGGTFQEMVARRDHFTVRFTVDGRSHRSTVRRKDLTVLAAGVCLAGQDDQFDLQSLVGVLREGARDALLFEEEIHE